MSSATAPEQQQQQQTPPEGSPAWWEGRQSQAVQKINRFCENWIFALIIAMGIRHFFLEAYRIPTTSMEPMLYGDAAFTKADHVLVDKFLFRFTGPERGDVTVFQYPVPEVEGPGGPTDTRIAYDLGGERIDTVFGNPALHRNFVKRCLALPGDVLYFAGGDLHLLDPATGQWDAWQKPADMQERLWQEIYRYDAQPDYERHPLLAPWQGRDGARVVHDEGLLALRLPPGGAVAFTQPMYNLYLREGQVKVGQSLVSASMLQPMFTVTMGTGTIWDLDRWDISRVTTADLDHAGHGSQLRSIMDEQVQDVRFRFTVLEVQGQVALDLTFAGRPAARLALTGAGWQLRDAAGGVLAEGGEPVLGSWELIHLDGRLDLRRGDGTLVEDLPLEGRAPAGLVWSGDGSVQLARVGLDRDIHYSHNGFLEDESRPVPGQPGNSYPERFRAFQQELGQGRVGIDQDTFTNLANHLLSVRRNRRMFIDTLVDPALRERLLASLQAHEEGRENELAWLQALGVDPATAIRVPEQAYLLMGDNSPFSFDGRNWGWVPEVNLRGRVLFSAVLPFTRWQSVR